MVKRRTFRGILLALLVGASAVAIWSWFRPYDWAPDPEARYGIRAAQLIRDQSYFWLNVQLDRTGNAEHDLLKPVRLETAAGRRIEPADTTFEGTPETGTTRIWFRFWLEKSDLEGPLKLHLNDGALDVKTTSGIPSLGATGERVFTSHRW